MSAAAAAPGAPASGDDEIEPLVGGSKALGQINGQPPPPQPQQQQQQHQRQPSAGAALAEPPEVAPATAASPPLATSSLAQRRYSIALVSDFFLPGFGGVEVHIYNLAQCLLRRGHKVIVMTRAYGDRNGVRYVTNGLKVYHMPFVGVALPPGTTTLPSGVGALALMRDIFVRERVDIVHGHQTTSNLCHEAMFHGGMMGLRTCFTDHSLFGFSDAPSIHINKVLQWSLCCVDECICVSNTSRENTVLRASIPAQRVNVIPNATDTSSFAPLDRMRYRNWGAHINSDAARGVLTIVVITRLVYRKGADLFVDVIPEICKRHSNVNWIVGGDGPRLQQLQQMVDRHALHHRVRLMGALKHSEVRDVLTQGQVFLNCSLTEAFCIAIIEAASCGLLCVSTNVGGVPEVLPAEMLLLAEPDPVSIVERLEEAIRLAPHVRPWDFHDSVRRFYSWDAVAERTERVYDRLMCRPVLPPAARIRRYFSVGAVFGLVCLLLATLDWLLLLMLEWLRPAADIEVAPTFPVQRFQQFEKLIHSRVAESSGAST
jgi:phosphatidylinositol glycan class A protein